ncbi:unnamed protein product, partial [Ectocarpus fasciculatus]
MRDSKGATLSDRPLWCSWFGRGVVLLAVAGSNAQGFLMAPNGASIAATSGSHRPASAWKSLQPSATRATGSRENALSAVSVGKEIDPVYGGKKAATEVVVVGAGVGGLATAARLAKA